MFICICNSVNDKTLDQFKHCSLEELQKRTKLGTKCGKCLKIAQELLDKTKTSCHN